MRHFVLLRMLRYPVKVQREHSQRGVVRIWERVDDRMKGVTAHSIIFNLGGLDK